MNPREQTSIPAPKVFIYDFSTLNEDIAYYVKAIWKCQCQLEQTLSAARMYDCALIVDSDDVPDWDAVLRSTKFDLNTPDADIRQTYDDVEWGLLTSTAWIDMFDHEYNQLREYFCLGELGIYVDDAIHYLKCIQESFADVKATLEEAFTWLEEKGHD